ncbi:MAG: type I restriction endonuclease [Cyanobacteria bacterium P01_A01_bin.105]
MVQSIPAQRVKLSNLRKGFDLQWTDDLAFFQEWSEPLSTLTDAEQERLDRVKANYRYLLEYPVAESVVKMVVLSPLLDIAGFFSPPFRVAGEVPVEVEAEDEGEVIKGNIDALVVQEQLWAIVIEAKNAQFSISKAIPQTLAYMLSTPQPKSPVFGLITNGSEFLFLKLLQDPTATYATSNLFSIWNQGNDFYKVAKILKHLGGLVAQ